MALGRLGHYEVLERIGSGGMGVVFKARDTRLGRILAIKIVADDLVSEPEYRARLLREARAEASLNHPSIATCFDVGELKLDPPDLPHPGTPVPQPERVPYLAMEYVPGEDLLTILRGSPLALDRVLDLAIQIAAGLEVAHQAGVIHRDLKPGNVRVTPDGRAKILDFGLARVRAEQAARSGDATVSFHTSEGRVLGTTSYMAPEQAQGRPADARSDLFSFGVVLYQMVTGRLPFEGGTPMAVLYAVANVEPPPMARYANQVPDELERIVRKLMAPDPAHRYQSAHETLTDLERLRQTSSVRAAIRAARRPRRLALAAAVVLVAGVAAAALWMGRGLLEPPSRNVAVLPFENLSGDSTLDYVSSGLADAVRSDLVEHTNLNVASRRSAEGAASPSGNLAAVARELGAGSLLSGTLRKVDEGLRLEVELVNAPSGYVRWSASYPFSNVGVFRIKRDILEHVGSRLAAKLDFGATRSASGYPTASVQAYDAYLQGERALNDADDPQGPDQASELFGRALVLDPEFALAWAERSRALLRIYSRDKRPEALRTAEQAADRALELQPSLLEARIARAQIYRATSRTREAIAEIEQVIRARPSWDEAYLQLAATYRNAGMLEEAERNYRRAVEIHPDDWRNWNSLGALLTKRGDYAGARAAFEQIVKLVPDKNRGYEQLAALAMLQDDYEGAAAQYRRLPTPVQDATLASNIGTAYFYTGRLKDAEEYYSLAVRLQPRTALYRRNLGDCWQRMGRAEEARGSFREAARLVEQGLEPDPENVDLRFERALCLGKAGECDEARRVLAGIGSKLAESGAAYAYSAALVHGVCGDRAGAIAALRTAIRLGVPAGKALDEVEFGTLRDDPEFRRLTGAAAPPDSSRSRARG